MFFVGHVHFEIIAIEQRRLGRRSRRSPKWLNPTARLCRARLRDIGQIVIFVAPLDGGEQRIRLQQSAAADQRNRIAVADRPSGIVAGDKLRAAYRASIS